MDKEARLILLLELARKNGGSLTLESTGLDLDMLLAELVMTELMSFDSGVFTITAEGKKILHLFDIERKNIIESLERYAEVVVDGKTIDGRIPMVAYTLMASGVTEPLPIIVATTTAVFWKDMVRMLNKTMIGGGSLENMLLGSFVPFKTMPPEDSWKELGETEEDAQRTAKWLLNPYPQNYVNITR